MTYHSPMAAETKVLALHCSGASGRQWRRLQEQAAGAIRVVAPDLYGTASAGHWAGQHAISLADEAERLLSLPELGRGRFHLVGHSYGGGVALKLATMVPERIASLTLYEPSAFHLLHAFGARGRAAFGDINRLATAVAEGLVSGAYRAGAASFVEYWNGPGSWASMKPEVQAEMVRYLPKACVDFRALFEEDTPLSVYRALDIPMLVMVGELAPAPTRVVAEALAAIVPGSAIRRIAGAGHMGAISHAGVVNESILAHISQAATVTRQSAVPLQAA